MVKAVQSAKKAADIWILHIALQDTKPSIWRRFAVPSDMLLEEVHAALQIVMGWEDEHMHRFMVGEVIYGLDEEAREGDGRTRAIFSESNYTLSEALGRKRGFDYLYDFGDCWVHRVTVEKRGVPAGTYPQLAWCLEGAHACPPEDIGGTGGYYHILEQLADPENAEYEEAVEWFDDGFDPTFFDLQATNEYLIQFEPLEAREVYQVLKDTALGQRVMREAEHQADDECDNTRTVEIDDWWIVLVSDEHGVACCPLCRAPDGRIGSLTQWHRSGTDPAAFLSAWEKEQIEGLLKAL